MDPDEARARAQSLLQVIEAAYAVKIRNRDEIVVAITRKTCAEPKILKICTVLNTWIALHASPEGLVEVPLEVVTALAQQIEQREEYIRSDTY